MAMAGGVLLSLGALLDWTGVPYSSTIDRGLAMAAGLLAVLVALVALWRWTSVMWLGLVAAALGLNMGIVNYIDISTHSYEYTAYPNARVGVGIYLVVAGALLIMLGTVLWLTTRQRRRSEDT
jgi:uncharacterized membrane protein YidH (DUF202 family)